MTYDILLEEVAFEEELLSEEFEELIDEDLKEFENSLFEEEGIEEELKLELIKDEFAMDFGEMETLLFESDNISPLENMIMVLKKHPGLKITLSL